MLEVCLRPARGTSCALRISLRLQETEQLPTLATNLSRMSRGKMIGVRYNKDFNWVGGNIAFFED